MKRGRVKLTYFLLFPGSHRQDACATLPSKLEVTFVGWVEVQTQPNQAMFDAAIRPEHSPKKWPEKVKAWFQHLHL